MSKRVPVILLLLCGFSVFAKSPNPACDGAQGAAFGGGDGRKINPYLVCNHEQLQRLSTEPALLTQYFKLGTDLGFEGRQFPLIGSPETPFQGGFDGDGYTFSAITLSSQPRGYNAPFRQIQNAQIENLTVDGIISTGTVINNMAGLVGKAENSTLHHINVHNIKLYSRNYSGGIVGELSNSSLYYASVDGVLEQDFGTDASGGLVGWAKYSDVFACASHVNVTTLYAGPGGGVSSISSLIGQADESRIRNVYADGDIDYSNALTSDLSGAGGLIGIMHESSLVNAFYAGKITIPSGSDIGGAVGGDDSVFNYSDAVFWDTQVSGITQSAIGVGKKSAAMKKKTFWVNQGFDASIWILRNNDYPSLLGSNN